MENGNPSTFGKDDAKTNSPVKGGREKSKNKLILNKLVNERYSILALPIARTDGFSQHQTQFVDDKSSGDPFHIEEV